MSSTQFDRFRAAYEQRAVEANIASGNLTLYRFLWSRSIHFIPLDAMSIWKSFPICIAFGLLIGGLAGMPMRTQAHDVFVLYWSLGGAFFAFSMALHGYIRSRKMKLPRWNDFR